MLQARWNRRSLAPQKPRNPQHDNSRNEAPEASSTPDCNEQSTGKPDGRNDRLFGRHHSRRPKSPEEQSAPEVPGFATEQRRSENAGLPKRGSTGLRKGGHKTNMVGADQVVIVESVEVVTLRPLYGPGSGHKLCAGRKKTRDCRGNGKFVHLIQNFPI